VLVLILYGGWGGMFLVIMRILVDGVSWMYRDILPLVRFWDLRRWKARITVD